MSDPELMAKLDAIDRKLDYVVRRQEYVEDLITEMTPVVREAINASALILQEYDDKGYFAVGKELMDIADTVVTTYGPGEVAALGSQIVSIMDTVKNVTQPDVLDIANDATDVIHNADEVEPVGMFGAVRATRDEDVQHGMAIALEILRHLGQSRGGRGVERRGPQPGPRPVAKGTNPATPTPPAHSVPHPHVEEVLQRAETVEWEGRTFTSEGFLLDATAWDEDLARKMAAGLGIQLSDDHWTVIEWARQDYLSTGASPNVRRIAAGSGLGTKRIYELYPKSPGKTNAMLAGLPKPVGCV